MKFVEVWQSFSFKAQLLLTAPLHRSQYVFNTNEYLSLLKHSPALHHSIFIGRGGVAVDIDLHRYRFHRTASSRRCLIYESVEEACREISCSPISSWEKERARRKKVRKTATKVFPFLLLPPSPSPTLLSWASSFVEESFSYFFGISPLNIFLLCRKSFSSANSRALLSGFSSRPHPSPGSGLNRWRRKKAFENKQSFPSMILKHNDEVFSPVSDFFVRAPALAVLVRPNPCDVTN